MIGPCDVCRNEGEVPQPGEWAPCCAAFLCPGHARDYPARARAMAARDGVAGGLVGALSRWWGR